MVPLRSGGRGTAPLSELSFGRMVFFSLVLHVAVAVLFSGFLFPRPYRELRQVIEVDLTMLPVQNPQAGRPDGRPDPATQTPRAQPRPSPPAPRPEPAPRPQPAVPAPPAPKPAPPQPVAPKPEPKPAPAPPPKPQPKAEAPPVAKTPPPPPKPAAKAEPAPAPQGGNDSALEAIERMRRQREMDQLKEKLAALATSDSRGNPGTNAPLGTATGRGTEAGIDQQTWIQAYLKENWNLSKYQVGARRDLKAKVKLVYDPQGGLLDYIFVENSREVAFDDSVRRAILSARQLPFKPERRLEITAEFNLKDLLE